MPESLRAIRGYLFGNANIGNVIFKGKTLKEVKQMTNYPFGIKDESIIKCKR